jgi:hypothetical protein
MIRRNKSVTDAVKGRFAKLQFHDCDQVRPVLLTPTEAAGGRNVRRGDTGSELLRALAWAPGWAHSRVVALGARDLAEWQVAAAVECEGGGSA